MTSIATVGFFVSNARRHQVIIRRKNYKISRFDYPISAWRRFPVRKKVNFAFSDLLYIVFATKPTCCLTSRLLRPFALVYKGIVACVQCTTRLQSVLLFPRLNFSHSCLLFSLPLQLGSCFDPVGGWLMVDDDSPQWTYRGTKTGHEEPYGPMWERNEFTW